jgi:hypothetical protein
MTTDPTRSLPSSFQAQAELELLQLILQEHTLYSNYPWNPAEPEAEAYFADLEREVLATGWAEENFAIAGQSLATTLDQMWASVLPTAAVQESVSYSISTELFQQIAGQIPQQLLERIIQQARQVLATNLSLAEQLVVCAKEVLPAWGEDDLQVLARPFAYAMRGAETEMLEAALRSVRYAAWTELSGIEQARLSLAIARYAIAQMPEGSIDHRH